jgi:hypothetical protein
MLLCLQSLVVVVQLDVLVGEDEARRGSFWWCSSNHTGNSGWSTPRATTFFPCFSSRPSQASSNRYRGTQDDNDDVCIIHDSQPHYPRLQNIASSTTPVHIHFLCVTPSVPLLFIRIFPNFLQYFLCKVSQILYEIPTV